MESKLNITDFSHELLCQILQYLPLREVLSFAMLSKKALAAVEMHLRLCKSIDFCQDSVCGYMPSAITDDHLLTLFKKCPHLEVVYGLHPVKIERRRLRKRAALTIPGIIEALSLCFHLKAIETSDLRLFEAIMQHLPQIEIIGHFQNRDGLFPPQNSQRLKLQPYPRISCLRLIGVEVPELTAMPHLQHLHLQCVRFTKLQPFRAFLAQNLKTFVMKHCIGPSVPQRYLSLIIALSSSPYLSHLELVRVPLLNGLFQRAVEDSYRHNGFVNLRTLVIAGCKGILEADLGHLMIVSSKNLHTLYIQPSLTKDSLFVSLSFAECSFPQLRNLHLGYIDNLNSDGEWSNDVLLSFGLAEVPDTPSSITDSGMKVISQLFPRIKTLSVSNCPHLMVMYQWMAEEDLEAWSKLTDLTLQKCHCLQLSSFALFVSILPSIQVVILSDMFREPPKGCSHVGLSAGTGLGMSSAVVSNQDEHIAVQGHHQDYEHPGDEENDENEREFIDVENEENPEPPFMALQRDFFDAEEEDGVLVDDNQDPAVLEQEHNEGGNLLEDHPNNSLYDENNVMNHSLKTSPSELKYRPSTSFASENKSEDLNEEKYHVRHADNKLSSSKSKCNIVFSSDLEENKLMDEDMFDDDCYRSNNSVVSGTMHSRHVDVYDPHKPSTSKAGSHLDYLSAYTSETCNSSDSDSDSNYKSGRSAKRPKKFSSKHDVLKKVKRSMKTEESSSLSVVNLSENNDCTSEVKKSDSDTNFKEEQKDKLFKLEGDMQSFSFDEVENKTSTAASGNCRFLNNSNGKAPDNRTDIKVQDDVDIINGTIEINSPKESLCDSPCKVKCERSLYDHHTTVTEKNTNATKNYECGKCIITVKKENESLQNCNILDTEIKSTVNSSENNDCTSEVKKNDSDTNFKEEQKDKLFKLEGDVQSCSSEEVENKTSTAVSGNCRFLNNNNGKAPDNRTDIKVQDDVDIINGTIENNSPKESLCDSPCKIKCERSLYDHHTTVTEKNTNATKNYERGKCIITVKKENESLQNCNILDTEIKSTLSDCRSSVDQKCACSTAASSAESSTCETLVETSSDVSICKSNSRAFSVSCTGSALEEPIQIDEAFSSHIQENLSTSNMNEKLPEIQNSVTDLHSDSTHVCNNIETKIDSSENKSCAASSNKIDGVSFQALKNDQNEVQTKNSTIKKEISLDSNDRHATYDHCTYSTNANSSQENLPDTLQLNNACQASTSTARIECDYDTRPSRSVKRTRSAKHLKNRTSPVNTRSRKKNSLLINASSEIEVIESSVPKKENKKCSPERNMQNCGAEYSPKTKKFKESEILDNENDNASYYIVVPNILPESIEIMNPSTGASFKPPRCSVNVQNADETADSYINKSKRKKLFKTSDLSNNLDHVETNLPSTSKTGCNIDCKISNHDKNEEKVNKKIPLNSIKSKKGVKKSRESSDFDMKDEEHGNARGFNDECCNVDESCCSLPKESAVPSTEKLRIRNSDAAIFMRKCHEEATPQFNSSDQMPCQNTNNIENIEGSVNGHQKTENKLNARKNCNSEKHSKPKYKDESSPRRTVTRSSSNLASNVNKKRRKKSALVRHKRKGLSRPAVKSKNSSSHSAKNNCKKVPQISVISQGTQATSADIRRSVKRLRRAAARRRILPVSRSSYTGKISGKVYSKRPINTNPRPESHDKATSTSDPLLEDDAVQTLQLASDTLLSFTVISCGISDLIIDRCPKLFHIDIQACRILKKFQLNTCPALKRLNVSQCPKLSISALAAPVMSLASQSYILVAYEPCMQGYHPGEGEKEILSRASENQSLIIFHDFCDISHDAIQAKLKEKLLEWLRFLSKLYLALKHCACKKTKKKLNSKAYTHSDYPWSHDLRRIHGDYSYSSSSDFCDTEGRYQFVTNNFIFCDALETNHLETGIRVFCGQEKVRKKSRKGQEIKLTLHGRHPVLTLSP